MTIPSVLGMILTVNPKSKTFRRGQKGQCVRIKDGLYWVKFWDGAIGRYWPEEVLV